MHCIVRIYSISTFIFETLEILSLMQRVAGSSEILAAISPALVHVQPSSVRRLAFEQVWPPAVQMPCFEACKSSGIIRAYEQFVVNIDD